VDFAGTVWLLVKRYLSLIQHTTLEITFSIWQSLIWLARFSARYWGETKNSLLG